MTPRIAARERSRDSKRWCARLIETGVFHAGDATTMAEAAWAAVHGLVALLIGMPDYPPAERAALADTVARMVAEGLVKR